MRLYSILTETEKESYRTLLKFLLAKPNTDRSFFGEESLIDKKVNAFSYTTRNSNPKEYGIDIEEWQSIRGIRVLALEDGDVVSACIIKDGVVTGIITDDALENVGIGTNLLKYVKRKYPDIKFDKLRSAQGSRLVKRVGEINMKLKPLLNEITSDEMKKMGYKLIPFDNSKADLFVDWISNFDTTGKSPTGYKDLFDKIKYLKSYVDYIKDFKMVPQPVGATFSYWNQGDIDTIVDKIFSKKNTEKTTSTIKIGNITYINESLMSGDRFKKTTSAIDTLLSSMTGFHKKALTGGFTIRVVPSKKLRAKASYHSDSDEVWVSETYTREIGTTKYASLLYIIIHELGHRYEYKVGVPSWFVYDKWATTKYSKVDTMHQGEQFAECFALSFFGTSEFPALEGIVDSFSKKMGQ
jgi:hypothetical protein